MADKVLVCVTSQKTCENLIGEGARLSDKLKCSMTVVHVVKKGFHFLGATEEGEALEHLFNVSKNFGADMMVYRSDNVLQKLVQIAKESRATQMVLGQSGQTPVEADIQKKLSHQLPEVKMVIV
ncbi:MAG: universal stress protein [Bacillota bacterium]|nr:universal stress protein [Bacillota bacterium]